MKGNTETLREIYEDLNKTLPKKKGKWKIMRISQENKRNSKYRNGSLFRKDIEEFAN